MKIIKDTIESISAFGALPFYVFLSLFFAIIGKEKLFTWLIFGLVFAYLITVIIRSIYYKNRPNKESYKNIFEKIDSSAFPSLHSLRITLILVFISFFYQNINITILFSFLAVGVFFSRYYLRKHDLIDILGGIFIGLVEAFLVIRLI